MNTIQQHWKLFLFEGILFIILGFLAISMPVVSTLSFELFIGWLFLIGGVIQLVRSIQARHNTGFAFSLINSIIAILVGIFLLAYPVPGILAITLLLATYFLVDGILKIILGIQWRNTSNWGWLIFSGIVSIILSGLIFSGYPGTAAWVLGLLVGINMLFFGWALVALAFTNKEPA